MSKRHAQIQPRHVAAMSNEQLREQARLAEQYALQRSANNLDGFFAAMHDAELCRVELQRRTQ